MNPVEQLRFSYAHYPLPRSRSASAIDPPAPKRYSDISKPKKPWVLAGQVGNRELSVEQTQIQTDIRHLGGRRT